METYKPAFICPYCEKDLPSAFSSDNQGQLGACGCQESQQAWETLHRADIERRKRARGGRRRR